MDENGPRATAETRLLALTTNINTSIHHIEKLHWLEDQTPVELRASLLILPALGEIVTPGGTFALNRCGSDSLTRLCCVFCVFSVDTQDTR